MFRPYIMLFVFLSFVWPSLMSSQEINTFMTSDFGLRGNVKSCLVVTDYGKEEYHFDTIGRLTKSITRFNDFDYETTYYKYRNDELSEKRVENYLDNEFDRATSIANFYTFDSTAARKVTEKIVSYTKQLLEQNVYRYNQVGNLIKMTRTDTDGTDVTLVSYDTIDGKSKMTYRLNGKPVEMVERWNEESEAGMALTSKSTVKYFDGKRNTKTNEVYGADGKLISKADSLFDASTEKWILEDEINYTYGEYGLLEKTESKRQNFTSTKEYIYQFDGTESNNWVKEIITPANTYKTRRITYYEVPERIEE